MRAQWRVAVGFLLVCGGQLAESAWSETAITSSPINCKAPALSTIETEICSNGTLASLDQQLANLYSSALAKASSSDRVTLVAQQKAWLEKRNQCDGWGCLIQSYNWRIYDFTNPPVPFSEQVPSKKNISELLAGKWEAMVGPKPERFRITTDALLMGRCPEHYEVLDVRPEHGTRDPLYILTIAIAAGSGKCHGEKSYAEATLTQEEVRSASVRSILWRFCNSLADLKNPEASCNSYWSDR